MKNHKLGKFIALTLFLAVVGFVMMSGTYSKYTSSASGSDTVTVAKWVIKAGEIDNEQLITGSGATVAFNLFDTILDDDGQTAETNVTSGKIAPGTSGKFELSVKNESEVNAEYGVSFAVSGAQVPFEFKVNGGDWSSSLSSVATTALNVGASDTVTVYWRWVYENGTGATLTTNDGTDTGLGIDATATTEGAGEVTVTATLNVSQVD